MEAQLQKGKKFKDIVSELCREYAADEGTLIRSLKETVEHVEKGYPVPTDKRILVEDWEEFIILHANFGSLTNRALAQLLGHILSEKIGYGVVVQHDPYRIFIQTMGAANADHIVSIFNELKTTTETTIRALLIRAAVKTGIFKRRMIHVARRFGALKKWADFGSVSLRSLLKSFEGTAIYEEALKEVFTKDLDLEHMLHVLERIREDEIEIIKIDNGGIASPIARVGIERVSMKTDLIPPERMRRILIESTKARLLNEVRSFICTQCWEYLEMIRIKDLPQKVVCPKCGSPNVGLLDIEEEKASVLTEKRGERLTKGESTLKEKAEKTARLIRVYGKPAALALCVKRIRLKDAEEVLKQEKELSDKFFELLMDAERKALSRRFW
jgi:ATP-dependent Lhr-like helicase